MLSKAIYSETELLLMVSEGDEVAFKELFELYAKLLFPYLSRLTGSGADAEEIIQETLLRVWIHRDELPILENPRSWLFRVASNQAYNWLEKKTSMNRKLWGRPLQDEAVNNPGEELVSFKELKKNIAQAVGKLPARRKLIYQLSREEGMTVTEISQHLNVSKSTVKNTIAEALSFIRDELKKSGHSISIFILLFWK